MLVAFFVDFVVAIDQLQSGIEMRIRNACRTSLDKVTFQLLKGQLQHVEDGNAILGAAPHNNLIQS